MIVHEYLLVGLVLWFILSVSAEPPTVDSVVQLQGVDAKKVSILYFLKIFWPKTTLEKYILKDNGNVK